MTLRKLLVSLFISAVLGLQLLSQVLTTGGRLWPFMDYPMYSYSQPVGARFSFEELRVLSRTTGPDGRPVSFEDLGVRAFRFVDLLKQASRFENQSSHAPGEDGAARLLSQLISSKLGPSYHTAQIWARRFEIGPAGLVNREAPWEQVREWSLRQDPSEGDAPKGLEPRPGAPGERAGSGSS